MYIKVCLFLLLVTLSRDVMSEICGGYDVSGDPRIEARQLDGLWHTQGTVSTRFPSITTIFFQDQGKIIWTSDWNSTTRTCSHRHVILEHLQSLKTGPFATCFTLEIISPDEARTGADEFSFFLPTTNLLIYHRCYGTVTRYGRCSEQPFFRIMTRTLDLSRKEKYLIDRRLRQFGESMRSVTLSNPRGNGCRRPMQENIRRRKYY